MLDNEEYNFAFQAGDFDRLNQGFDKWEAALDEFEANGGRPDIVNDERQLLELVHTIVRAENDDENDDFSAMQVPESMIPPFFEAYLFDALVKTGDLDRAMEMLQVRRSQWFAGHTY